MIYEIVRQDARRLSFRTHSKARRGRGVLFATMPFVAYLLACVAFFLLAAQDLTLWERAKSAAWNGLGLTAFLSVGCFILGTRVMDALDIDAAAIRVTHRPALGVRRHRELACASLKSLAIDPSLRSLGADVLLVAITADGARIPLAEGEPHSGQVRELAEAVAMITSLPVEAARFSQH